MGSKKNRKSRQKRLLIKPYCFVVEGCTEKDYIQLLKQIYKASFGLKFEHVKGGSAKSVLKTANKVIQNSGHEYQKIIIVFDGDRYNPKTDANLHNSLTQNKNVEIFISMPCIENLLLAHFQAINFEEPDCKRCENKLKTYIHSYKKGDCGVLARYIKEDNIENAANNYPEFQRLIEHFRSSR